MKKITNVKVEEPVIKEELIVVSEVPEQVEKVKEEILPQQGDYIGKFVDVVDDDNSRIGTGKCIRDDFDSPFITLIEMVCPPKIKGKIVKNKKMTLCHSQKPC